MNIAKSNSIPQQLFQINSISTHNLNTSKTHEGPAGETLAGQTNNELTQGDILIQTEEHIESDLSTNTENVILVSDVTNEFISTSPVNENSPPNFEMHHEFNQVDLNKFQNIKSKNFKNPCIAYLNINSLRGDKFTQLKEMLSYVKPEILCIDETKLTSDFPTAQFHIDGYHYPPFRRDRPQQISSTYYGGGKIVYVKEDLISDRLEKYETLNAETICLNLTIQERKWFLLFAYRP